MGEMHTDRRYLTPDELMRVCQHVRATRGSRERGLLSLLLIGRRIGEVCALMRSHLDLETWLLTYTPEKSKHPRTRRVLIPEVLRPDLLLCARRASFPPDWRLVGYDRVRAWRLVRSWGNASGVPWIFPHALRHTFAVIWIDSGGSLTELQSWMDHEDPRTTTHYLRWSTTRLNATFDRLGLSAILGAGGPSPVTMSLPGAAVSTPGAPSPPVPVGFVVGGADDASVGAPRSQ